MVEIEVSKSRPSVGKATLTIVASRIVMIAPRTTTDASTRVAREADVSPATVFNYFPTKEDLVYGRMEAFEEELLSAVRDRPPGESVLEAFGRFVLQPRG